MSPNRLRCLIMGAAGRDFHDFQTFFRRRPEFEVVAFTAAQIPFIAERRFPAELAGEGYEQGIPIHPEEDLGELIRTHRIDFVFLSYSDLSHEEVMHKASTVQANGASFGLLGPGHTQLDSEKPTIAVTAVRTGAGKSPISQMLGRHLATRGQRVGIIRHPMPYGDLSRQVVERFATADDLDKLACTIEEREEYAPYIEAGLVIFAGVDYARILAQAEEESDVILWDGGNNDFPFIRPDLSIVVVDALRPGHELRYYPGETNLRSADIVVINKVASADPSELRMTRERVRKCRPEAKVIEADLEIDVDRPDLIRGQRVLVVEDGPTLTHGGMAYGAGTIAARFYGAAEIVDPNPTAVGSIAETLRKFPHLKLVLPAVGYSETQREELTRTIESSDADAVVDASPAGLGGLLKLSIPVARVRYSFKQLAGPDLKKVVDQFLLAF